MPELDTFRWLIRDRSDSSCEEASKAEVNLTHISQPFDYIRKDPGTLLVYIGR